MKEPMRLRDEGATALERALLEAGSAYKGSPSARARTLGALGLAGSAGLMASTTAKGTLASAGKLSLGKLSLTKLLAGAAICGAVAAVPSYRAWHRHVEGGHAARAITAATPIPALPAVEQIQTGTAVGSAAVVAEAAVAPVAPPTVAPVVSRLLIAGWPRPIRWRSRCRASWRRSTRLGRLCRAATRRAPSPGWIATRALTRAAGWISRPRCCASTRWPRAVGRTRPTRGRASSFAGTRTA